MLNTIKTYLIPISLVALLFVYFLLADYSINPKTSPLSQLKTTLLVVIWGDLPVIIALLWSLYLIKRRFSLTPAFYGFFLSTNALMLVVHIVWFADSARTQTGSSISEIYFTAFPFYSMALGLIVSGLTKLFTTQPKSGS